MTERDLRTRSKQLRSKHQKGDVEAALGPDGFAKTASLAEVFIVFVQLSFLHKGQASSDLAPSSDAPLFLLVVRPGAPSSVLAPSKGYRDWFSCDAATLEVHSAQ